MKRKRDEFSVCMQSGIENVQCDRQNIKEVLKDNNHNQITLDKASYDRLDRYSLLVPNVMLALFLFCSIVLVLFGAWSGAEKEYLPSSPSEVEWIGLGEKMYSLQRGNECTIL